MNNIESGLLHHRLRLPRFAILTVLAGATRLCMAQCPTIQMDKVAGPDAGAGDQFGYSVALSGTTAIVGSRYADRQGSNSGAATVLRLSAVGEVLGSTPLLGKGVVADDHFGSAVAIWDHTAVVGATGCDLRGSRSGAAFVFRQDQHGAWRQIAELTASDGSDADEFGNAVAIWDHTIVVGASEAGTGFFDDRMGAAYVYHEDETGAWREVARLRGADTAPLDHFGFAVALNGDRLVVGNWPIDEQNEGVYVFRENAIGVWKQTNKVTPTNWSAGDRFGCSISMSHDVVVVGAREADRGRGGAHVFQIDSEERWVEAAKLVARDRLWDSLLGCSVSVSGDRIVIGARGSYSSRGSAYLYRLNERGAWGEEEELVSDDGDHSDLFGCSVAIDGCTILVGAQGDDERGVGSGSAYTFRTGCAPILDMTDGCPGPKLFRVRGVMPESKVGFLYALGLGSFRIPNHSPCRGTLLGLNSTVRFAALAYADGQGTAVVSTTLPNGACGRVYVQAVNLDTCGLTTPALIK